MPVLGSIEFLRMLTDGLLEANEEWRKVALERARLDVEIEYGRRRVLALRNQIEIEKYHEKEDNQTGKEEATEARS